MMNKILKDSIDLARLIVSGRKFHTVMLLTVKYNAIQFKTFILSQYSP